MKKKTPKKVPTFAQLRKAEPGRERILMFADYIESLTHEGGTILTKIAKGFDMSSYTKERKFPSYASAERIIEMVERGYDRVTVREFKADLRKDLTCGAPSCIAGHAAFIADPAAIHTRKGYCAGIARDWLGVSPGRDSDLLFCPSDEIEDELGHWVVVPYHKITPAQAARALRRFARGERNPLKLWKGISATRKVNDNTDRTEEFLLSAD